MTTLSKPFSIRLTPELEGVIARLMGAAGLKKNPAILRMLDEWAKAHEETEVHFTRIPTDPEPAGAPHVLTLEEMKERFPPAPERQKPRKVAKVQKPTPIAPHEGKDGIMVGRPKPEYGAYAKPDRTKREKWK